MEFIKKNVKKGFTFSDHFSGIGLTKLPPEIRLWSSVTALVLANNKLRALPTEICLLHSLEYLYLVSVNKISSFKYPSAITKYNYVILMSFTYEIDAILNLYLVVNEIYCGQDLHLSYQCVSVVKCIANDPKYRNKICCRHCHPN